MKVIYVENIERSKVFEELIKDKRQKKVYKKIVWSKSNSLNSCSFKKNLKSKFAYNLPALIDVIWEQYSYSYHFKIIMMKEGEKE